MASMLAKCNNPVVLWEEDIPLDTVILCGWQKLVPQAIFESPRVNKKENVKERKEGGGHLKHLMFYYSSGGPPSLQPCFIEGRTCCPSNNS